MKLIHCADLHLDSKLHTHLDRDRAKLRRDELLRNFERLAQYASENGVEAVLIAGDLFDRDNVSALTRNTVLSVIEANPQIRFYYLRGNHDLGDCLANTGSDAGGALPNLFLFGNRWKTFYEGKEGLIAITGM
jgi:DNA repair exonuclease SbcCD nuclease subunit